MKADYLYDDHDYDSFEDIEKRYGEDKNREHEVINIMSIVSSFDNESKSIIDLDDIFKASNHIADICIVTFSIQVKEMVLKQYNCKHAGFTKTANGNSTFVLLPIIEFIKNFLKYHFIRSSFNKKCH